MFANATEATGVAVILMLYSFAVALKLWQVLRSFQGLPGCRFF